MIARESIYSTLFEKWRAIAGINTVSRRLKHWSDVPFTEQPAIFQIQRDELSETLRGIPQKWTLRVDIYLYVNSGNDDTACPSVLLNPILDSIEAALAVDPASGFQTLGGLVSHAWIADRIETDEGVLGAQAVAIIPIQIVVSA